MSNEASFIEIKDALERANSSEALKEWKKNHPESFLAYAQTFLDSNAPRKEWYIGFYDKKEHKIATFVVGDDVSLSIDDDNVLGDTSMNVSPISLEDVKLSLREVLETIAIVHKKEYPREAQMEIIVNLQFSESEKTHWNISYFTRSFKVINFKAIPSSGEVISHGINSIMDFGGKN